MIRVLIVCTGNICRSPMAEGLLRKLVRESQRHGEIVVESAGTHPLEGAPASPESIDTAAENGVDLRGHAARPVNSRLVGRADLILTMEPSHEDRILSLFREAQGKTHLITTFGDPEGEADGVPDPIGLGPDFYRETFQRIEGALRAALPRILAMVPEATEPPAGGAPNVGRGRGK
jgi:protein-tyrosine-phosphatase